MSIVAWASLIAASSDTWHWNGQLTSFALKPRAGGNVAIKQFYDTCTESTTSGTIQFRGTLCATHLLSSLISSMSAITIGGYIRDIAKPGIGLLETTEVRLLDQQKELAHDHLLHAINGHLSNVHGSHRLLATGMAPSHVHPSNGIAIRFNVHGDSSILHVHTNGTHAVARFDNDLAFPRQNQHKPGATSHYTTFTGVNGVKLEAHLINSPAGAGDYSYGIERFASQFADSTFHRVIARSAPKWMQSDTWIYEVRSSVGTATFFYGRLVAELGGSSTNDEHVDPAEFRDGR